MCVLCSRYCCVFGDRLPGIRAGPFFADRDLKQLKKKKNFSYDEIETIIESVRICKLCVMLK